MSTPAIALLQQAAQTCEDNAKIQRSDGYAEEAVNSEKNAESYRDALILLELDHAQQRYHQRHTQQVGLSK